MIGAFMKQWEENQPLVPGLLAISRTIEYSCSKTANNYRFVFFELDLFIWKHVEYIFTAYTSIVK